MEAKPRTSRTHQSRATLVRNPSIMWRLLSQISEPGEVKVVPVDTPFAAGGQEATGCQSGAHPLGALFGGDANSHNHLNSARPRRCRNPEARNLRDSVLGSFHPDSR